MKKASCMIVAMFCMFGAQFAMAEPAHVTDQPEKHAVIAQPIETSTGAKLNDQPIKARSKKLKIEICYCYDQVKPPCWKSPETPPCPK